MCLLDRAQVAQHLLVVADREECLARVLRRALGHRAEHDLAAALREPFDLASPLRLDRRRAHDQHLLDLGLAREQLRDADRLDRLAEAHIVGEHRAAGADRERDAVELVRQELGAEQLAAQRVVRRIGADLLDACADPVAEHLALDVLLGIGVHGDGVAGALEARDAPHEIPHVRDGMTEHGGHDRSRVGGQLGGRADAQLDLFSVAQVDRDVAAHVRLRPHRGREPPADLVEDVQDVLAGAERVLAEIGTRTVRVSALLAAQRDPVGPPRFRAGHGVVGPRPRRLDGANGHLLGTRALGSLGERAGDQILRAVRGFGRWLRQTERDLVLQHHRERSADVIARTRACGASPAQPARAIVRKPERHDRRAGARHGNRQRKALGIGRHPRQDIDLDRAAAPDQHLAACAEQLGCLHEGELAQAIVQGQGVVRFAIARTVGRSEPGCGTPTAAATPRRPGARSTTASRPGSSGRASTSRRRDDVARSAPLSPMANACLRSVPPHRRSTIPRRR